MSDLPQGGTDLPDDPDAALAAEYVLRLLEPGVAAACAARVVRDPGFAAEVARWEASLSALDGEFAPVPPPPGLERRIEARLFAAPVAVESGIRRLWRSAGLWRAVAAGALALALFVGVRPPVAPPGPDTPRPLLISALQPIEEAVDVELLVYYEAEPAVLNVARVAGGPGQGRSHEVWLVPEGSAPVSLGVMPEDGRMRVPVPGDLAARLVPGATLAVSDEPAGGSPTGAPTGPVLAAGALTEI
jgi:anti-sigma-K factor RskA